MDQSYTWNATQSVAQNIRALRKANKFGGWVIVEGKPWIAKVWIERGRPTMSCQRFKYWNMVDSSPCDMKVAAFIEWMERAIVNGGAYPGNSPSFPSI